MIWAKEIAAAPDPEEARLKFTEEYDRNFAHPYLAAALRLVDEVILPAKTRKRIIQALQALENKQKDGPLRKHGIMPV